MEAALPNPKSLPTTFAKIGIIQLSELTHGKPLGGGAFGTVVEGKWTSSHGNGSAIPVAIKLLKDTAGANASQELLKEAFMMASTDHPNLVKLLGTCMTSPLQLVTELIPLGNLRDYAKNNKDIIGSRNMLLWCVQIAKGMEYLESRRLVHRDLAARNVLVQSRTSVKITDFGLARLLDFDAEGYRIHGLMPIRWSAIECFTECIFTHKSDVWAFGVTIWELLTFGDRPYKTIKDSDFPKILLNKTRLDSPPNCKPRLYKILRKTWSTDPSARPSFQKLVEEFLHTLEDPSKYLYIPVEVASTSLQVSSEADEADKDPDEIRQFYSQIKSGYGGLQEDQTLYQHYNYGINLNPQNGYLPVVPSSLGLKLEELIPKVKKRILWRQLPMIISSGILSDITEKQIQVQEAIFETITSETAYLKSLNVFISLFYKNDDLRNSIKESESEKLFGNIIEIRDCSLAFLSDLLKRWNDLQVCYQWQLGYVMLLNLLNFSAYKAYCRNIPYQRKTMKFLVRSREQFLTAFCLVENDERCQGLSFDSFSLLPMQRLTRYPLLINAILDKIDPQDSNHYKCCRILLEQLVRDCDDGIKESLEELVTIEMEKSLQLPYGWKSLKDFGKFIMKTEFQERKDPFDNLGKSSSWFPRTFRDINSTYWLILFTNRLFVTRKNFIQKFEHVEDCNPSELSFIKMQNVFGTSKHHFIIHLKHNDSVYFLSSHSFAEVENWNMKLKELKLTDRSASVPQVITAPQPSHISCIDTQTEIKHVEIVGNDILEGTTWGTFIMRDEFLMMDLPFDTRRRSWLMKPFRNSRQYNTSWLFLYTERIVIMKEIENGKFEVIDDENPSESSMVRLHDVNGMELFMLYFNAKEAVYFFTLKGENNGVSLLELWIPRMEKLNRNCELVRQRFDKNIQIKRKDVQSQS